MYFKLDEESKKVIVSDLDNGGSHMEIFLNEDSKLKDALKERYKNEEPTQNVDIEKIKEIWKGNIVTFYYE